MWDFIGELAEGLVTTFSASLASLLTVRSALGWLLCLYGGLFHCSKALVSFLLARV